jgi:hypothetical protein
MGAEGRKCAARARACAGAEETKLFGENEARTGLAAATLERRPLAENATKKSSSDKRTVSENGKRKTDAHAENLELEGKGTTRTRPRLISEPTFEIRTEHSRAQSTYKPFTLIEHGYVYMAASLELPHSSGAREFGPELAAAELDSGPTRIVLCHGL